MDTVDCDLAMDFVDTEPLEEFLESEESTKKQTKFHRGSKLQNFEYVPPGWPRVWKNGQSKPDEETWLTQKKTRRKF